MNSRLSRGLGYFSKRMVILANAWQLANCQKHVITYKLTWLAGKLLSLLVYICSCKVPCFLCIFENGFHLTQIQYWTIMSDFYNLKGKYQSFTSLPYMVTRRLVGGSVSRPNRKMYPQVETYMGSVNMPNIVVYLSRKSGVQRKGQAKAESEEQNR